MTSVLRLIFIVVTAAFALAITAPDVALPWRPFGTFGFEANEDARITDIFPGLPADRAGVHVGDVILGASGPRAARSAEASYSISVPGSVANYLIRDGGGRTRTVRLTSAPYPRTLADNVTDVIYIASFIAFLAIAAVLLMLRPSISTWAFYVYAAGQIGLSTWVEAYPSDLLYTAIVAWAALAGTVSTFALLAFALAFPTSTISGWRRAFFLGGAVLCALFIVSNLGSTLLLANAGFPPAHQKLNDALVNARGIYASLMIALAVIAFVGSYRTARPSERLRLRWVILGAIAGSGGYALIGMLQTLPAISISPPPWGYNLLSSLNVLFPISVAYAVLKHRLIEVRFFLSRALVYSLVTTVAVATLALVEFLVAQSLEATRLGLVIEVAGAVAIGLGISRLHRWVDELVDRYVFRSVYQAEQHLTRIGEAMMFARSPRSVDEMLAVETKRALRLASATVVREFDPDEPLALGLLAGRETIDHGDLLAMPLLIRHHLFGYVLYDHHTNGSAIDPNERAILEKITARAANAYDHITSEERATENERLRLEVEILRSALRGAPAP